MLGSFSCKTRFLGSFARLRVFLPIDFEIRAVEEAAQDVVKIVVSGVIEYKVFLVKHNRDLSYFFVLNPNALSFFRKGEGFMEYVQMSRLFTAFITAMRLS